MNVAKNLSAYEAETAFLESMGSQYEARGYTFTIHPGSAELPEFFAGYAPDAVARRPGNNIAIELKSRATVSDASLQRIRRLFEGREDWQLSVAYMGSAALDAQILPVPSRTTILAQVRDVERLAGLGDLRAAFMVAWSLLEAALNSARPNAEKRPRAPGSVVQALAMDGLISAETEKSLRSLIELRNRVVHGDLTAAPTSEDVQTVIGAIRAVLS